MPIKPPSTDPVTSTGGTTKPPVISTGAQAVTLAGSFDPIVGKAERAVISDIFAADLNNNGTDEAVFAGRLSQPATPENWSEFNLNIFSWDRTGKFSNETKYWFNGTDNQILGTEPSVKFADFNADGRLDMFVSPGTDQKLYGPATVYFNTGASSFTKTEVNIGNTWSHDSTVLDVNRDGKSDILVANYGGPLKLMVAGNNNTFKVVDVTGSSGYASGVAVGNFFGDGSIGVVLSDDGGDANDTRLYRLTYNGSTASLTFVSALPMPLLENNQFGTGSHDVRAVAHDFNNDGKMDILVASRPGIGGLSTWPDYSELQFLQNDGTGHFTDVTSKVMVGYDKNTHASYQPIFIDVNGDGLLDIFLSHPDPEKPNAQILIKQADGRYVAAYGDTLKSFMATAASMQPGSYTNNGNLNILRGPNNELFLVTSISYNNDGDTNQAVFIAKIGANGVITASTSVASLQAQWPWLTEKQAVEILNATSTQLAEGNLLNLNAAFSPVGGLWVNTTSGLKLASGSIGGIDGIPTQFSLHDGFNRNFNIKLATASVPTSTFWNTAPEAFEDFESISSNFAGGSFKRYGMRFSQNNSGSYTVGTPYFPVTDNFFLRTQFTNLKFNPWLSMSGMWGEVNRTKTTEVSSLYRTGDYIFKLGVMNTRTEFTPGLVTGVSNIISAWGEAGTKQGDFGFYAGVLPKVLSGNVQLTMPTSVDRTGKISYTKFNSNIKDNTVSYVRFTYSTDVRKNINLSASGIYTSTGNFNLVAQYNIKF